MSRLLQVLCLTAVVGCSADNPTVVPLLDLPPEGSDAYPLEGVDSLRLSIAEAGSDRSLSERTVALGEPLSVTEVPFLSDLVVHLRGLRGADAEVSYGRTCAFDTARDAMPAFEPRLYFARIATWGPAPSPIIPVRRNGHAVATPDGSALFLGGDLESATLERFDPLDSGQFEALTDITPRLDCTLAALGLDQDRWVIVGGVDSTDPDTADAVPVVDVIEWRPGLPAERIVTPRVGPRLRGHAAAALVDGSVVVIGGEEQASDGAPFTVTGKAWTLRSGDGGDLEVDALVPELAVPRRDHTLTRLGSEPGADVLVIGGRDAAGDPVATTELYRPLSGSFETVEGALLSTPRWAHAAIRMPGGFVLVIGGLTANPMGGEPIAVADMELYDPVQGRFSPAGTLPAAAGVTGMSVTLLPDGRVLLAGGTDVTGQPSRAVHIARLDPIDGQVFVSPTSDLAIPRVGHSAVSLCDGTVLVVGGNDDPGDRGAERYSPPSDGRE